MWLHENELLKVCCHSVKFAHHKHSGSGDKIILVFQVILQDYVVKLGQRPLWLYKKKPPKVSHHSDKCWSYKQCGSKDIMVIVCNMIEAY